MSKEELDNLVRINRLKAEPVSRSEFVGMVKSARRRLVDAQNKSLDPDSQFDLAYGAAHRLALAALRLGSDKSDIQVLLRAHNERNLAEYEGRMEIDQGLLADLIRCTKKLAAAVGKLDPPAGE
jgi:hypothetical protein